MYFTRSKTEKCHSYIARDILAFMICHFLERGFWIVVHFFLVLWSLPPGISPKFQEKSEKQGQIF